MDPTLSKVADNATLNLASPLESLGTALPSLGLKACRETLRLETVPHPYNTRLQPAHSDPSTCSAKWFRK